MTYISMIDIKTEVSILFLALKLAYAIGMEDDFITLRKFSDILRENEYRRLKE